jgi:hypothetical protein
MEFFINFDRKNSRNTPVGCKDINSSIIMWILFFFHLPRGEMFKYSTSTRTGDVTCLNETIFNVFFSIHLWFCPW